MTICDRCREASTEKLSVEQLQGQVMINTRRSYDLCCDCMAKALDALEKFVFELRTK